MKENPVKGVKRPKLKTDGFQPWTEDDVIAFYRTHGPDTQARLAFQLLLFTGLRRIDVWKIGHGTSGTT
jgi:integrase